MLERVELWNPLEKDRKQSKSKIFSAWGGGGGHTPSKIGRLSRLPISEISRIKGFFLFLLLLKMGCMAWWSWETKLGEPRRNGASPWGVLRLKRVDSSVWILRPEFFEKWKHLSWFFFQKPHQKKSPGAKFHKMSWSYQENLKSTQLFFVAISWLTQTDSWFMSFPQCGVFVWKIPGGTGSGHEGKRQDYSGDGSVKRCRSRCH